MTAPDQSGDFIKNVILLGATGDLGTTILNALIDSGLFTVTIARRATSRSEPKAPREKYHTVTLDEETSQPSLEQAFKNQHAVVVAFRPGAGSDIPVRIADAAAATPGMRRVIAADYGSCDSTSARAQELVPLFKRKTEVRERLQALSASSSSPPHFSWTSIVCGHFFDWGLRENFLHFDLKTRQADILGDGTTRSSLSTLGRVAETVVRVLGPKYEGVTRNKMIFVQSFCVSQLDVLASLERAYAATACVTGVGGSNNRWTTKYIDAEEFIAENKRKADAGDKDAVENLVFALGAIDGNWEIREGFAMKLLDMEDEDLDEVVERVVREIQGQ